MWQKIEILPCVAKDRGPHRRPELQAGVLLMENQAPRAPTLSLHYASNITVNVCNYKQYKFRFPFQCGINPIVKTNLSRWSSDRTVPESPFGKYCEDYEICRNPTKNYDVAPISGSNRAISGYDSKLVDYMSYSDYGAVYTACFTWLFMWSNAWVNWAVFYVSGRTGRAGKTGVATTFLTHHDSDVFYDLKQWVTNPTTHRWHSRQLSRDSGRTVRSDDQRLRLVFKMGFIPHWKGKQSLYCL